MKQYKFRVEFADHNKPQSGTTEAPSWEHARIKVELFWGRQGEIKQIYVEDIPEKDEAMKD